MDKDISFSLLGLDCFLFSLILMSLVVIWVLSVKKL